MSLDFDYTNVKGPKTHPGVSDELHPVLYALIWLTIGVGMGKITEENAKEFADRARLYELIEGPMCHIPGRKAALITLEDVRQYIGLRTNVTYVKEAQFLQHMWARVKGKGEPLESVSAAFDEHAKKVKSKQTQGA